MDDKEHRIRERAYQLWEEHGRPEGREAEHWEQARREAEQEEAGGGTAAEDENSAAAAVVDDMENAEGVPGLTNRGGEARSAEVQPAGVPTQRKSAGRSADGRPVTKTARKPKAP